MHAQGQKVIRTMGVNWLITLMKQEGFENNQEGYENYAKYLYETMIEDFKVDGLDFDYDIRGI